MAVADGDAHLEPQGPPAAVGQPARAGVALEALAALDGAGVAQEPTRRPQARRRRRDGGQVGQAQAGSGIASMKRALPPRRARR
ncbi:hypothetical protein FSW04_20200 [Baekduia soli]|uniref:Uncharacterized protein n=2 Tax=Baekduia soli TaxID=496014 RepID=A0A5B8U936_9ACTN|nr:hypothetical protein FSW04_20200 [Baekduia soli]